MKNLSGMVKRVVLFVFVLLITAGVNAVMAQDAAEESKKDLRPVRSTFESVWLIDNQTVMVPFKGTLEMDVQHRFGLVENTFDDLFGIYAPSVIRLGFNYVPIEKLQMGFGITNRRLHWDFHAKYAILRQARSGGSPFSITYLGNMAIDTRDGDNFEEFVDRIAFFNQVMIARKVSDAFSVQLSGNWTHTNFPAKQFNETTRVDDVMNADHLSVSALARLKFGDAMSIIINYDQPITTHDIEGLEPEPNLGFGLEFVTSSHTFQIFLGNATGTIPQLIHPLNQNGGSDFVIGFNMTRLWNF